MSYNFSFSYSKWTLWNKCPLAFKLQNIDKVDTGPTPPALVEGRQIHDEIGNYIAGKSDTPPDRLQNHFSIFAGQLRHMAGSRQNDVQIIVEQQMAFDVAKLPVRWFGKNARYRFIWDAAVVDHAAKAVTAVDWKTGKPYGSYDDQMEIFSVPAFWTFPEVETFTGYLMYLDSGVVSEPYTYTREQFERSVWPGWEAEIAKFEADTTFAPTPSKDACRFCEFGSKNLGICQYEA